MESLKPKGPPRLGSMKRYRTTIYALALLVGGPALLPSTALASGPLLSGYGRPGAGAQAIIGASLLNGRGGGSSGGGSPGGGSGGSSDSGASTVNSSGSNGSADSGSGSNASTDRGSGSSGVGSSGSVGSASTNTVSATGRGAHASRGGREVRRVRHDAGTSTQLSGAYGRSSNTDFVSAGAGTSWFSGSDLLALALAAGALALTAAATVLLARVRHD